mgnify:CR=1 FL=1|tara:strand:- start:4440 stop:5525 length:1086 start_codon:yes stop_codon:yes gene_type:complete
MDVDQIIKRATIGITIVGFLIVIYAFSSDDVPINSTGYTELYFLNPDKIPEIMEVDKKYPIDFVISSNEPQTSSYKYIATFNNSEIASGEFKLKPGKQKIINIEIRPKSSSWELFENDSYSKELLNTFTSNEAHMVQGSDGNLNIYPEKFNLSTHIRSDEKFTILNQIGTYTSTYRDLEFLNNSQEKEAIGKSEMGLRNIIDLWSTNLITGEIMMTNSIENPETKYEWNNQILLPKLNMESQDIIGVAAPNRNDNAVGNMDIIYSEAALDFETGIPGKIYVSLSPNSEDEMFFYYSSKDERADFTLEIERNYTITTSKGVISVKNNITEKVYRYNKIETKIVINSDAGKSYEIKFQNYVTN